MGTESILVIFIIGAIAGWLAGKIVKGFGFGLLGNIVVGIVGAFVAGSIFPVIGLGFGGGILSGIIHATLGAVICWSSLGLLNAPRTSMAGYGYEIATLVNEGMLLPMRAYA